MRDPRVEAIMTQKNTLLVKNCKLPVKEIEEMTTKWLTSKKKAPIAGSFNHIEDLQEYHIKHFRTAPYMFKPLSGTIFGGMLLDDSLDYVHLVLVSEEVLVYILDLNTSAEAKKEPEDEVENINDLELGYCEQCGQNAWDGYICHACGMKKI